MIETNTLVTAVIASIWITLSIVNDVPAAVQRQGLAETNYQHELAYGDFRDE